MTHSQKQENTNFFKMIIMMTKEGGSYIWPDAGQSYTIKGGKMVAETGKGKKMLIEITTPDFHKHHIA